MNGKKNNKPVDACKGKEIDSLLVPPERTSPDCILTVKLIWDLWPSEVQENKFVLFHDSKFVVIHYNSNGKLILYPAKLKPGKQRKQKFEWPGCAMTFSVSIAQLKG